MERDGSALGMMMGNHAMGRERRWQIADNVSRINAHSSSHLCALVSKLFFQEFSQASSLTDFTRPASYSALLSPTHRIGLML